MDSENKAISEIEKHIKMLETPGMIEAVGSIDQVDGILRGLRIAKRIIRDAENEEQ